MRKAFRETDVELYDSVTREPGDIGTWIELWWGNAAEWSWSKRSPAMRVGYALAEAESLPSKGRARAIENLQRCDLLLCPSSFSARAYMESPIDIPIRIVPFGVDTDEMRYVERNWSKRATLKFLLAGAAQLRKGSWLGIDAFLTAFGKRDNVMLTVWSSVKTPMLADLIREYGDYEKVIFDDTVFTSSFEAYKDQHILVSPHLSEGFGLQINEAISTGMPALVSRCSSPREFFSPECGWWIEMSERYAPVCLCLDDTEGLWRLPDVSHMVELMQYCKKHRGECEAKGAFAARHIRDNFTWRHTADAIITAIGGITNEENIGSNASIQRGEADAVLLRADNAAS